MFGKRDIVIMTVFGERSEEFYLRGVGCHWRWIMLTNHKIASGAAAVAVEETERARPMCQCKYDRDRWRAVGGGGKTLRGVIHGSVDDWKGGRWRINAERRRLCERRRTRPLGTAERAGVYQPHGQRTNRARHPNPTRCSRHPAVARTLVRDGGNQT